MAKVENLDARESRGHLARDFRQFSVGEAQVVGRRLQGHRALSSRTRHLRKLHSEVGGVVSVDTHAQTFRDAVTVGKLLCKNM